MEFKELKNKMSDIKKKTKKNLLDGLNRSREVMENRISELDNRSIEFTQSEQQKENRQTEKKKTKQSLRDLYDNNKNTTSHNTSVPQLSKREWG